MGLFGKKEPEICNICGEITSNAENKAFIASDGIVCGNCIFAAGYSIDGATKKEFRGRSVSEWAELKQYREDNKEKIQKEFEATREAFNSTVQATPTNNAPSCPKCGSTSISADKKGFGIGKAVVGNAIAGPIGMVAGNIGAKKVIITCLSCGKQWEAGKG